MFQGGPGRGGIMPLTEKGQKILKALTKTYGKDTAKRVFYAGTNKGTFKGVHKK
jgi:hypothetical protein